MTGEFELPVFCCDTGGNLAGSRLKKEKAESAWLQPCDICNRTRQ